jgi:hypothetical protein
MSRRACTRAAARVLMHSLPQQRSRSIAPPFVAEFPPERSDPHRALHREHHLPRLPTRQEGRPRRHTSYPTGLGRSRAQARERPCADRPGDPPRRAHDQASPPRDTPRRSRARGRDRPARRYRPRAPRGRRHLPESPIRRACHRQPRRAPPTPAARGAARAARAAARARTRWRASCRPAPKRPRSTGHRARRGVPPAPGDRAPGGRRRGLSGARSQAWSGACRARGRDRARPASAAARRTALRSR